MGLKHKVLVVDDDPSTRKYLKVLLEADGCAVDTVSSGKDAISKIEEGERPDFIILDVLMPEMNGLQVLAELMYIDRSLYVIITSCSSLFDTIKEAFELGARDYLVIGYDKAELDAAMLRAKQRNRTSVKETITFRGKSRVYRRRSKSSSGLHPTYKYLNHVLFSALS